MANALVELGIAVEADSAREQFLVRGCDGVLPKKQASLFVGNAGTAARFLAAMVCLGNGVYRLHGVPRMYERPQAALFKALRELGYRVDSERSNDNLPVKIFGHESLSDHKRIIEPFIQKYQEMLTGETPRKCKVSIEESSQFASALLLCAKIRNWKIEVVGKNAEESPYVAMTSKLIAAFPKNGGTFPIEPDASSGSYFWAAERFIPAQPERLEYSEQFGTEVLSQQINTFSVAHWPHSGWQIDEQFRSYLLLGTHLHGVREFEKSGKLPNKEAFQELIQSSKGEISRMLDLGDSIMMAIVTAPLGEDEIRFTDLGRLRVQETERVVALRTELTKCGAKVIETGDTLEVFPSRLHGAEIETYNDHRMAMCFAILGLKIPGIKIKNPACVKKTFPNFFQKLAAAPPYGLGATILDASGRPLGHDELFAE
jgi:3-phosphoshikimate 1-carboxyvinyltransferase